MFRIFHWDYPCAFFQKFYDNSAIAKCQALQNLIDKYRITHVIVENDDSVKCSGVEKTYIDNLYKMYERRQKAEGRGQKEQLHGVFNPNQL